GATAPAQRVRLLSAVVGHAVRPGWHESFDVVAIDVGERAKALLAIAHTIRQDITWRLVVVLQLVSSLRQHDQGNCCTQQQGHDRYSHDDLSSPQADGPRMDF